MGTHNYEEMIRLYHNINLYCMIGALVFLAIAIFLFFWLKIPKVFGELTGRTAQKAIEEMVAENAESGSLTSIKVGNDGRKQRKGKNGTGRIRQNTGRMGRKIADNVSGEIPVAESYTVPTEPIMQYEGSEPTDVLDNYGSQPTDVLDSYGSQPTDVLDNYGSQPTDVLDNYGSQPTDILDNYGSQPTGSLNSYERQPAYSEEIVYQQPDSETMVLNQNILNTNTGFVFVIERSIEEIHTNEVI